MMRFSPAAAVTQRPAKPRGRGLAVRLGGALACAALATSAFNPLFAQAPAGTGLKGLLPAEAPEGLLNTIGTLPETWSQWGESVTTELTKFYGETAEDVAGQRAALDRLKVKLGTLEKALGDPQYASIKGQLQSLHRALSRRIEVMEAVLDTLTVDPAAGKGTALDSARQNLTAAADAADSYLDVVVGGDAWKKYLQISEVRSIATSESDPNMLIQTLSKPLTKVRTAVQSNDATVRDFAQSPALKTYYRDLDHALIVLTRANAGVDMDQVRTQLKNLLEGLEKYEATGSTDAAAQVRDAYNALRGLSADGGERLSATLRQHYFNANMHFAISEGFLNRVLAKTHIEEGGVNDFILGANVYGCQITNSKTHFDLLPSANGAFFRIHLDGTVTTNTDSHKGSVTIFSNGNHQFVANKGVHFDGDKFSTYPANMHVFASNEPVDASTRLDNVPFLGQLGKSLAITAAMRKRPEAEAIAAQRVTSRVGPEFDNEVDKKFTDLNGDIDNKITDPLKSENLYPDYRAFRSTDTEFDGDTRLMSDKELGGSVGPVEGLPDGDMVLRLHESLINNFLDRLNVGGKTMTEDELRKLIEDKLSKIRGKEVSVPKAKEVTGDDAAKAPKAFIFTEKDPLRVKIADGKLNLIIRAGFQRDEDKGGNIPPQIVTIPLTISVEGEEVVVKRGDVIVDPVDKPDNVAEQLARAGVIKKKIETSIQDKHDTRTLKVDKDEGNPVDVNVVSFEALDGWLSVWLR